MGRISIFQRYISNFSLSLSLSLFGIGIYTLSYGQDQSRRCFLETITSQGTLSGVIRARFVNEEGDEEKNGNKISLAVNVRRIGGGSTPDFNRVYDPENGEFRFSVSSFEDPEQEEDVEICIVRSSSENKNTKLRVGFEFHSLENGVESVRSTVAHENHVNTLAGSVVRLTETMKSIRQRLVSYRELEQKIRYTSESNNFRVGWLSVGQAILLACAGIWQVVRLKQFFRAKKLV